MLRYLGTRLLGMAVVMLIVATLVFLITRLAPGDPAAMMLGEQASAADVARLSAQYGLDRPLPEQFGRWLMEVARGNLGHSIFLQIPVGEALLARVEPTLLLALLGVTLACAIGIPCGVLSAVWHGRLVDQAVTGVAMLGASMPSFWFGMLLMQLFAVELGWFPVAGYGNPEAPLFFEKLRHLVLPAVVLGVLNSSLIIRFTRASMLDVLSDDYVRTARAKGLPEVQTIVRHALRNALVPVVTVIGLTAALMIGGAAVTETVFGLPGIGSLVVSAVLRRDYPVIQGALLVIAATYVLINLGIDLLYMAIDPRIRY
ncbi:ABC transporter permease [Pseudoduganella sp. SL102]|uniref:ABC transporter permease n=1 Tax=Pseudoduganella sp. SL102 TaxID=2995154 RepID=UPI00248BA71D|nr:ABC transporter permease [Pseudoduganella sp. SL102]WBS05765.1 ABC transporter permease [Pseudoduganella sp. SL102]